MAVSLYREIVLIRAESREVIGRWPAPSGTEKVQSPVCGLSFSPDRAGLGFDLMWAGGSGCGRFRRSR